VANNNDPEVHQKASSPSCVGTMTYAKLGINPSDQNNIFFQFPWGAKLGLDPGLTNG
jgi:hypothetical protein